MVGCCGRRHLDTAGNHKHAQELDVTASGEALCCRHVVAVARARLHSAGVAYIGVVQTTDAQRRQGRRCTAHDDRACSLGSDSGPCIRRCWWLRGCYRYRLRCWCWGCCRCRRRRDRGDWFRDGCYNRCRFGDRNWCRRCRHSRSRFGCGNANRHWYYDGSRRCRRSLRRWYRRWGRNWSRRWGRRWRWGWNWDWRRRWNWDRHWLWFRHWDRHRHRHWFNRQYRYRDRRRCCFRLRFWNNGRLRDWHWRRGRYRRWRRCSGNGSRRCPIT